MSDNQPTVRELQKELALKTKRIAALEAFVGEVLSLSRYPWLHPETAPKEQQAKVTNLLARAWYLLPVERPDHQPTDQAPLPATNL